MQWLHEISAGAFSFLTRLFHYAQTCVAAGHGRAVVSIPRALHQHAEYTPPHPSASSVDSGVRRGVVFHSEEALVQTATLGADAEEDERKKEPQEHGAPLRREE